MSNFNFLENMVSPKINEGIPFIWYIILKNGDMISEYDNDLKHTQIEDLESMRPFFKEMGLIGNGGKVYINADTGELQLGPSMKANVYLKDSKGNIMNITQNKEVEYNDGYKNFISRKYISYDVNLQRGESTTSDGSIEAFTMGYEIELPFEDNKMKCTFQYGLPMGRSAFIDIELTPEKDFEGEIVLKYGTGSNEEVGKVHLFANQKNKMTVLF